MRRATFLASVRSDFVSILAFIAEQTGSVAVGEAFVKRLRAHCHKMASYDTTVGRPRSELRPDIRSIPFGSYVIFFRYVSGRFEVVNIVESHRDIAAFFDERGDS